MPIRYSITDARSRFPTVVKEAEGGKPVELTRNGKPVAVVVGRDAYERLSREPKGFYASMQEFRRRHDLEKLKMDPDEIYRDVRDRRPPRKVRL
mgnify:CR=1 FL=1